MGRFSLETIKERCSFGSEILDREDYLNAAVLIPLVTIDQEEHILLEQRAAHIRQGREICFPGGHFDTKKDKDFLQTALRETEEELGIATDSLDVLGHFGTLLTPRGVVVECFVAHLAGNSLDKLSLDLEEVERAFTVPLSWFAKNPPEIFHTRVEIQSSYIDDKGVEQILLPVEELGLPPRYAENRSEWLHRVFVYRHPDHIIWGLTAAIIHSLVKRLAE